MYIGREEEKYQVEVAGVIHMGVGVDAMGRGDPHGHCTDYQFQPVYLVTVKIVVCWNVTPYNLVETY